MMPHSCSTCNILLFPFCESEWQRCLINVGYYSKVKQSKFTHTFALSCSTSHAEMKLSDRNLKVTGLFAFVEQRREMPTQLLNRSNHPGENLNTEPGCNSSICYMALLWNHQCFTFKPFCQFSMNSCKSCSSTSGQNGHLPLPIHFAPLLAVWMFTSLEIHLCRLFLLMPNF